MRALLLLAVLLVAGLRGEVERLRSAFEEVQDLVLVGHHIRVNRLPVEDAGLLGRQGAHVVHHDLDQVAGVGVSLVGGFVNCIQRFAELDRDGLSARVDGRPHLRHGRPVLHRGFECCQPLCEPVDLPLLRLHSVELDFQGLDLGGRFGAGASVGDELLVLDCGLILDRQLELGHRAFDVPRVLALGVLRDGHGHRVLRLGVRVHPGVVQLVPVGVGDLDLAGFVESGAHDGEQLLDVLVGLGQDVVWRDRGHPPLGLGRHGSREAGRGGRSRGRRGRGARGRGSAESRRAGRSALRERDGGGEQDDEQNRSGAAGLHVRFS